MAIRTLSRVCLFPAICWLDVSSFWSQISAAQNTPQLAEPYVVVSLVDSTSEFYPAAELLAARHKAEILQTKPDSFESILVDQLKNRNPAYVAFVIHPADLDINLVNRLVVLSTEVDADPFVDFAWGVITGRDGAAAEKLVKASDPNREKKATRSIAMFGVAGSGLRRSLSSKTAWPLRTGNISVNSFSAKGEKDEDRDDQFIAESISKIGQAPIVLLASHGYPDGLVAGPKAADMKGVDLSGCVLLNIACYTGVTGTWYDQDYQTMKVRRKSIEPENSFCLQAIDCGVAGYFAYACPRPAGPSMMGDAISIAASGQTLGELFRENQQSIVLAQLLVGNDRITPERLVDEAAVQMERTPGEIVKQFSTGGLLFGDPAFRPFPAKTDWNARLVEVHEQEDRILVDMKTEGPVFHFFASDQVNYWEERKAAWRMECSVPLGGRGVDQIRVLSLPEGIVDYRWVAAIEQVSGERHLRFKLNFAQPEKTEQLMKMTSQGLAAKIEIHTSDIKDSSDSILRGESPPKEENP